MGLVEDDGVVLAQERVALDLGEEHPIGEELDDGGGAGLVAEADLAAHLAAPGDAELLSDTAREGEGGDAAGLGAGDAAAGAASSGEAELGDLGGLAGAGLAGEDEHLVGAEGVDDLPGARGDGELRREIEAEREGGRCGRARHEGA